MIALRHGTAPSGGRRDEAHNARGDWGPIRSVPCPTPDLTTVWHGALWRESPREVAHQRIPPPPKPRIPQGTAPIKVSLAFPIGSVVTMADLKAATGLGEGTITSLLSRWRREGKVDQPTRGRYRRVR